MATSIKERVYILKGGKTPINYILRSRHHVNNPLQYFDGKRTRALRYASNQESIFEDGQNGDVALPAIIFRDGKLLVRAEDTILQEFLSKHPDNGKVFEEFDPEAKAEAELDVIEKELEAMSIARDLSPEDLEAVGRVILRSSVDQMQPKEVKRGVLSYAKENPERFLSLVNDENIKLKNLAVRAVNKGILKIGADGVTVEWAKGKNKDKVLTVPFGENAYTALAAYFKTDEGLDLMQSIMKEL